MQLNLWQPHTNRLVFWVSNAAYCITLLLFCVVLLVQIEQSKGNATDASVVEDAGAMLVGLSVFIFASGVFAMVGSIVLFRRKVAATLAGRAAAAAAAGTDSKKTPRQQDATKVTPVAAAGVKTWS